MKPGAQGHREPQRYNVPARCRRGNRGEDFRPSNPVSPAVGPNRVLPVVRTAQVSPTTRARKRQGPQSSVEAQWKEKK